MILLKSTDTLRLATTSTAPVDVLASFADTDGSTVAPGNQATAITTATTTTVVAAPASATFRTIRSLTIRNKHATTANIVTVLFNNGTSFELREAVLAAGEELHYDEANGWQCVNAQGLVKLAQSAGALAPVVNELNMVVLASDVVNNNATANTIADVTGLSFPVTSGETYWFESTIGYTAAATTTGSRWAVNGPTITLLCQWGQWSLTATTMSLANNAAYDLPAASGTSSGATAGNCALLGGIFKAGATGSIQVRFASEVASSAITAKAGSVLRWMRTL